MKLRLLCLLSCLSGLTQAMDVQTPAPASGKEPITVMTYNVRRKGPEKKPEHQWDNRKAHLIDTIKQAAPDVIGLQEPTQEQLDEIMSKLPSHYASVGTSRGSSWFGWGADELNPIIYNTNKLQPQESGTFKTNYDFWWFLRVWQVGWLPRICTWAHFKTQQGKDLNVYNTHLDNKYQSARFNQLAQIIKHQSIRLTLPTVLMGDFNNTWNDALQKFLLGYINSRLIARQVNGPDTTRTEFSNKKPVAIDHILLQHIGSVAQHTVIKEQSEMYASDHRPVVTTIEI